MRKILALGASTILILIVAMILIGISLGIVFQVPNFDRFAPNLLFFYCRSMPYLTRRYSPHCILERKNETSIKIPKGASPAVIEAIKALDSVEPSARKNAIEHLGQINDNASRESLARSTKHPYKDVRFQSAFKLARLGDDRGVSTIKEALYGGDRSLAKDAMDALEQLGPQQAPIFIELLDHEDFAIRFHAAQTLGHAGFNQVKDSAPRLIESLADDAPKVRRHAALSLGSIGEIRALPQLLQILKTEDDRDVLEAIIIALGKLGDEDTVQTLIDLFKRPNNTTAMVTALVTALRRIHTPEALAFVGKYHGTQYWEQILIEPNRQWQRKQQNHSP